MNQSQIPAVAWRPFICTAEQFDFLIKANSTGSQSTAAMPQPERRNRKNTGGNKNKDGGRGKPYNNKRNRRGKRNSGKGNGGRNNKKRQKVSEDDLNREMESYWMKDAETAAKTLDADMDSYWKKKDEASTEEAPADGTAENGAAAGMFCQATRRSIDSWKLIYL